MTFVDGTVRAADAVRDAVDGMISSHVTELCLSVVLASFMVVQISSRQ